MLMTQKLRGGVHPSPFFYRHYIIIQDCYCEHNFKKAGLFCIAFNDDEEIRRWILVEGLIRVVMERWNQYFATT